MKYYITMQANDNMTIPSEKELAKVERLIQKAVAMGKLSPEALAWLKLALDPWHDVPVTGVTGIPDTETGKSVIVSVTQEVQVSADPSWLLEPNWSLRVNTNPTETEARLCSGGQFAQVIYQTASGSADYFSYGVDVTRCKDGDPFTPGSEIEGLTVPLRYCNGIVKVIGKGVEVINTTAEIYQQGLCTVARYNQPEFSQQSSYISKSSGDVWSFCSTFPVRTAPNTLSELNLQPTKDSWHAKEGMYAPVIIKLENTTHTPVATYPVFYSEDPVAGPAAVITPVYSPYLENYTPPGSSVNFNVPKYQVLMSPQDSVCAMFTGLNWKSTLTVRCRWILELFPTQSDEVVLGMATPTCAYCPEALELYSRVTQGFPSAVMFKENPAGEWWKAALGRLGQILGPMISFIPHPLAQTAGQVITQGGNYLANSAAQDRVARREKNKTRPADQQKNAAGGNKRPMSRKALPAPKQQQKK